MHTHPAAGRLRQHIAPCMRAGNLPGCFTPSTAWHHTSTVRAGRRIFFVSLFVVLSTAACGANPTAGPERSSEPSGVPGVTGYLHTDRSGVAFLQWKTDASGVLEGTLDRATASGSPP